MSGIDGFLAGIANAGAGMLREDRLRDDQNEQQERMAKLQDELSAKREETRMRLQERIKQEQEEARQLRIAEQTEKIEASAEEKKSSRNLTGLIGVQKSVAGEAESASPEELKGLINNPTYRKIYEDAGYIPKATMSTDAKDRWDASKEVGADGALRKEYQDEYKGALNAEAKAREDARKERQLAGKEKYDRESLELRDKQISAAIAKSGGTNGGAKEMLSYIDNQRKDLKGEIDNLRLSKTAELKDEFDPAKKQEITKKYDQQISSLVAKREMLDKDFSTVRKKLGFGADDSDEKPKPEKSGSSSKPPSGMTYVGKTPDGRPVYRTAEGKQVVAKQGTN